MALLQIAEPGQSSAPHEHRIAIGIDLGTTHSLVATVLSGKAIENLKNSVIDELVVTDTIPLSEEAQSLGKIRQVSVASMVAETIRRINNEESISAMFDSYL